MKPTKKLKVQKVLNVAWTDETNGFFAPVAVCILVFAKPTQHSQKQALSVECIKQE
jgi:hypothetical protein